MPYKTIIIELLRQRPRLHGKLRRKRKVLDVVNRYARELKTLHEDWTMRLSKGQPDIDPSQIASAAMEFALIEMKDRLRHASPPGEPPLSDIAGDRSRNRTSRA
ncbi:MAG TPA: hypothetical protein VJZ71_17560 [Phycisphaerae bacterium]|nr:hypothetical protein [Phycisphaerae bacterium]